MAAQAKQLTVSASDRAELERRARSQTGLARDAKRARIVLLAAEGRRPCTVSGDSNGTNHSPLGIGQIVTGRGRYRGHEASCSGVALTPLRHSGGLIHAYSHLPLT
jgi:hypothetical protein